MTLPETTHFGFTRVGQGEQLSKNSYAALDADRVQLDALLNAIVDHEHSGEAALTGPTSAPTLTANTSGGALPAGTTFYYKVSYLDRYGLETSASPESSVTTASGSSAPTGPALTHLTTGGSLSAGTYSYVITFEDLEGGETTSSAPTSLKIAATSCNGTCQIQIDLPTPPAETPCINIYRQEPGQSRHYFLAKITVTQYFDDGAVDEDQSRTPPLSNSTASTNSVDIDLVDPLPDEAFGWKIYRAQAPGAYGQSSLVHKVTETVSETGGAIVETWTDVNDPLSAGSPRNTDGTLSGGQIVQLDQITGTLPLSSIPRGAQTVSSFCLGTIVDSTIYDKFEVNRDILPTELSAFFQTLPSGLNGTDKVRVRVTDNDATPHFVELSCEDDSGYYLVTWPTTGTATFEAESQADKSSTSPVVNDGGASGGQAVELNLDGEYVTFDMGLLDGGDYVFTAVARFPSGTPATNDLQLEVIDTAGPTTLLTETFTVTGTYADYTTSTVSLAAAANIELKVSKVVVGSEIIYVDKASFLADTTTLHAGEMTVEAFVDGSPASAGGDVQVHLTF